MIRLLMTLIKGLATPSSFNEWTHNSFLLHRNTHVVSLPLKPVIQHLACTLAAATWLGAVFVCLSFTRSTNHAASRQDLVLQIQPRSRCKAWQFIKCWKDWGKRRDQNGLKCTYCENLGNEVQMLLQKGKPWGLSFSSALPTYDPHRRICHRYYWGIKYSFSHLWENTFA